MLISYQWIKKAGILLLLVFLNQDTFSQSPSESPRALSDGFFDHGVAVPIASSRGTVATVDGEGHNVILIWLNDHRGTYSLLMIDIDQEKSEQFFLPFSGNSNTSILSSRNRYYTHFNGYFIEFDPAKRAFSFIGKTSSGRAMSMTEDDEGTIWAALGPDCSLVSYNPETRELKDHGVIHPHKARQQPRSIAADDAGWIYVAAGPAGKGQIVAFNPESENSHLVQPKAKPVSGNVSVFRGQDGKVYGRFKKNVWLEFRQGKNRNTKIRKEKNLKSYVTGTQALFHRTFPDGKRIRDWISAVNAGFLRSRKVTIYDPKMRESREIAFNYKTEGASLMGVATGPNGKIIGGSSFPMNFFQYDPNRGTWDRHYAYGQFNTLMTQGDMVFIGGYPRGYLLKWNPGQKWISSRKKKGTNPQFLTEAYPDIFRPHDLLGYPDGRTIIMAGRPSGGRTGGGLLFWDSKTHTSEILKYTDVLPNQSTQSLVALPDGKILGGTTVKPGDSGGISVAEEAELYIMDLKSKKIEWSEAVIPNVNSYQDLCVAPNGLVMGVAENRYFFVFDPNELQVVYEVNLRKTFGSNIPYTQGQRSFVRSPNDEIYLLLRTGILHINPNNFEMTFLAESPAKITGGGAYLDGQIYYVSGNRSRIYSYSIPSINN